MKIGLISTASMATPPPAYGGEIYYWNIANELGIMGHDVTLFALPGSIPPHNGKLIYNKGGKAMFHGVWDYDNFKKSEDIYTTLDIVHDCSLLHLQSYYLNVLSKYPNTISTVNGYGWLSPLGGRPHANLVTGSLVWQKFMKDRFGIDSKMIYWGVDTDFYCPNGNGNNEYFLWISRFHPDKGLDILLDIAEIAGFPLKIAGSMEFQDHAEHGRKYLDRITHLPNVEYVENPIDSKHHERKRELYRNAIAFLYPVNYFECFGMVVAEALACGCPVVASPMGAMPEIIKNDYNGYICNSKNEFFNAIRKVHTIDRNKVRESALRFSVKDRAKEYEKLYQEIIEGGRW